MTGTSSEYARRADAHAEAAVELLGRLVAEPGKPIMVEIAHAIAARAQVHATLALADRQAAHTLAGMGQ